MSKLNVDQKNIKILFSDKKSNFLIPDYQRPYAWDENQCQTLWDDIFSFAFPENNYQKFEQNEEYFSNLENCDIESFTISLKSGSYRCYRCNSTSFIKEMKELGWLDFTSAECKELRDKLRKLKEEKYEKNCVINSAKKPWLIFSEKTEKRIKEYKNAKRLQDLWDKINKEDSTRAKIIKSFNTGSYYSSPKYSRAEFRTIMKLK